MATRVRVLARHASQSRSPVQPIVYSAAVYPDDGDIHVAPLWACNHEHQSAGEAYGCGLAWIEDDEGGDAASSA